MENSCCSRQGHGVAISGAPTCAAGESAHSKYFPGFLTLLSTISKFFNTNRLTDIHLVLQHHKQTAR